MQDQGKRLLLAVVVAMGFFLVWQTFIAKKPDEPAKPAPGSGSTTTTPAPGTAHSQVGVSSEMPTPPAATVTAPTPSVLGPEQTIELTHPRFVAKFSSHGGNLTSWHLTDSRYANDATGGELLPKLPDTGAFGVNFANSTYVLPAKTDWVGAKVSETEVKYTISTPQLDVTKTFVVYPDEYLVRLTVKVVVKVPDGKEAHETLAVTSYGFQNPNDTGGGGGRTAARVWESSSYRDGTTVSTGLASIKEAPRYEANIQWTGFEHPYLLAAYAPKPLQPGKHDVEKRTFAELTPGLMRTDMQFERGTFKPGGESVTREIVGYLGPKNYDQLENADKAAGFPTGFNATIDLGWFAFIGRPLLWLLLKFHELFGNWGIAIVLLTMLVKTATIYWTTKSMRSMKTMAVLGPQMKGLQEKYKEDKQRLQLETMALYKQYNVNPLTGCLPILLQMPIWLALYRMLSSAGELYQQPFIPGWINDLTATDPYYILPVILVVTMFAQARLTPQSVDPSQKMQQRMMQYGMPLMFGAMAFFFPAGLTLYIFTNTCLSALHSIYMNKFDKKSLAIAAQLKKNQDAAKTAGVKGAKDGNPTSAKPTKPAPVDAIMAAGDDETVDEDEDKPAASAGARAQNPGRAMPARQKRRKKGRGR